MPTETDLTNAFEELAAVARPLTSLNVSMTLPRRRLLVVAAAAAAVLVAILAAGLYYGFRTSSSPTAAARTGSTTTTACAGITALTRRECTVALAVAHQQAVKIAIRAGTPANGPHGWPTNVDIVAVTSRNGIARHGNMGHACRSGRLVVIELIGTFKGIVVLPPTVPKGSPQPDYTVHGVHIEADPVSGNACLVSVQTGTVEPAADASILYRRHR